ncbi:OmpA family protein [Pendulispora brunnea]|uniref:OmpA family protein n=1 Tax=Pendulispora brunnea TaxID=2905690 RepID=A0ABZ2JWL3_9BACT
MTAWKTVVTLALLSASFLGCADKPKAAKIPPTGLTSASTFKSHWEKSPGKNGLAEKDTAMEAGNAGGSLAKRNGAADDGSVLTSGLRVSDEIAKACSLPQNAYAPKFDFDSTAIPPDDRDALATIARCLIDGGLRGRHVTLVGRADRRGETEYNMSLGESRADAVLRYMHNLGVGRDRVKASSRGELDATGNDEESYALDRRVDIELVN